jgi:Flp pilus assembly protein TadD
MKHCKDRYTQSLNITFKHHMKILATALILACLTSATSAADSTPTPEFQDSALDKRMAAGRAAVKSENWSQSIAAFSEAVKLNPKSADAHNMLGYSYRKQATPDLPKAFEHYGIALTLDPKHRGANEYVGKAYLLNKQPEMANKHLASLEAICGKSCAEYQDLAKAIAAYKPAPGVAH